MCLICVMLELIEKELFFWVVGVVLIKYCGIVDFIVECGDDLM